MIKKVRIQLFSKELPKWFRWLNLCILLPILIYPLVFFTTIFLFDHPEQSGIAYFLFFVVNAYPVYLVLIAYFNSLLFQKNKILGSLLPAITALTLLYFVTSAVYSINHNIYQNRERENERKKQGYLTIYEDFKITNDKVYHYDTLIVDADAKTFEIVGQGWQRDKNYYYYFGKRMPFVDRNSFKFLGNRYSKDKFNVYYYENIIEGADTKTFRHIKGTLDGRDKKNCYREGKRIDCAILK